MKQFLLRLTIVITIVTPCALLCSQPAGDDGTSRLIRDRNMGMVYEHVLNGVKDVLGHPNDQGNFACNDIMVHVRYANDDDCKQHDFINPPIIIPIVSGLPWQKKAEILISRNPTRCLRYFHPGGEVYIHSYHSSVPIYAMKARIAASALKNSDRFANTIEQWGHIPIFLAIISAGALSQQYLAGCCAAAAVGMVAGGLAHQCRRPRRQKAIDAGALQATSHKDLKIYLEHAQRCPSELAHSATFIQRAQALLNQRNRCLESSKRKVLWKLPKALQDHALTFLRKKD